MTTVRIPPALHAATGGHRDVEVAGDTVRDVLAGLLAAFPGLEGGLLNQGELQPFVNLYVDGTDIEALEGLDTSVDPGATLLLLPAMAGGSAGAIDASGTPGRTSTVNGGAYGHGLDPAAGSEPEAAAHVVR